MFGKCLFGKCLGTFLFGIFLGETFGIFLGKNGRYLFEREKLYIFSLSDVLSFSGPKQNAPPILGMSFGEICKKKTAKSSVEPHVCPSPP